MATAGTSREVETEVLPLFRTIVVANQYPNPDGRVEVSPNAGRIVFQNQDPIEYRIRFYRPGEDPDSGVGMDLLLPAQGFLNVVIRPNDEFNYFIMGSASLSTSTGKGGGPITN